MSGVVVVDASLAAMWVLQEERTDQARALLIAWENDQVRRIAPSLFLSEFNSPVLKHRRKGLITAADARRILAAVLPTIEIRPDDAARATRAFEIADQLALRHGHDSLYLALAEAEQTDFWTNDERFYNAAHVRFPRVRWVGEPIT
jgi:predicted nucleic acid-binding protein